METYLGEGKLWIQNCWTQLENWSCITSCLKGLDKCIYKYMPVWAEFLSENLYFYTLVY